jgi:hypothetical protein
MKDVFWEMEIGLIRNILEEIGTQLMEDVLGEKRAKLEEYELGK